jgi:7-cyano-7-deazaguanine synthase in queuosine biosynthesis
MNEILCYSGGLDSYIAYHYLKKPKCIYFHTKQAHSDKELEYVLANVADIIVDHSLDFSKEENIYVPHRNLLFASRASVHAEKVWIAGLADDCVEDKTSQAFTAMSEVLSAIGKTQVMVDSPFWGMTKTEICKWFIEFWSGDIKTTEAELLSNSISCYSGSVGPCGTCSSCYRKSCAMFNAGMGDEIKFKNTFMVLRYFKKAINGEYISSRNKDILQFTEFYLTNKLRYFGVPC